MAVSKRRGTITPAQVVADSRVQRSLVVGTLNTLKANLDLDALGVVTISERENGTLHTIDGQHRLEVLRMVDMADFPVEAVIYSGLDLAAEAEMFRLLNTRSAVSRIDLFRVRVVEGDKAAVAMKDILDANGWKLANAVAYSKNSFRSVKALEDVYNASPLAAEQTIYIITKAWGHEGAGVVAPIVAGLGRILAKYGPAVDIDSMIDKLNKYEGGPGRLWGASRGLRQTLRSTAPDAVAEVIVRTYNLSKKAGRLPNWKI